MDWTAVITAIVTALIPTGGFVALFTIREKKTEMALNNANKINEQWALFAQNEEKRRAELKEDLDKKDKKIDELRRLITTKDKELDEAHTDIALAKIMICDKLGCMKRRPPFGAGRGYDLSKVDFTQEEAVMDCICKEETNNGNNQ